MYVLYVVVSVSSCAEIGCGQVTDCQVVKIMIYLLFDVFLLFHCCLFHFLITADHPFRIVVRILSTRNIYWFDKVFSFSHKLDLI